MLLIIFSPVVPAVPGSRVSRLGLEDETILWEENSSCSLSHDNLKILWVVNSENYIYKRHSLNRAKQV